MTDKATINGRVEYANWRSALSGAEFLANGALFGTLDKVIALTGHAAV